MNAPFGCKVIIQNYIAEGYLPEKETIDEDLKSQINEDVPYTHGLWLQYSFRDVHVPIML